MSKKIKIMRKRIADKKWLLNRRGNLIAEAKHWHKFEKFECSDFFNGKVVAEHNRQLLQKAMARVERQLNFINKLLTP